MTGQHTPGPWRSRELGSEGARIMPDYGDVRERGKTIADVRGRDTLTDFANARLIAAAPELLEACKGMIEWARRAKQANPGMEIARAKAAIAKARP